MPVHYLTIEADFSNQRIDNFLITYLKGVPETRIYRLIRKGEVRINKKRVSPDYRLVEGDQLRIPPVRREEEKAALLPSRSLITLLADRILYEDDLLLIINKPAGIPVHGGTKTKIGVIEALRTRYPKHSAL